jgi:hypothetical protein
MWFTMGFREQSDIQASEDDLMRDRFDDFVVACIEMIGRTGATDFQMRYHDDEQPTVWIALATYHGVLENVHLKAGVATTTQHQVAAGLTPASAAMSLLETLVDGGVCEWCHRPTAITEDLDHPTVPGMPDMCWYQYDPELRTFRRGCEGD